MNFEDLPDDDISDIILEGNLEALIKIHKKYNLSKEYIMANNNNFYIYRLHMDIYKFVYG